MRQFCTALKAIMIVSATILWWSLDRRFAALSLLVTSGVGVTAN